MKRTESRNIEIVRCDICHSEFEGDEVRGDTQSLHLKNEKDLDVCNECYSALEEYFTKKLEEEGYRKVI